MNAFQELGVDENTPISEVKKVYRKLCRKYHPDNGGDAEKFDAINKAYSRILNGDAVALTYIKPIKQSLRHESLFKFSVS